MSSPRRILDDPTASSSLRSDLQSTVESGTPYDPNAGFARLQQALASSAASEPGSETGELHATSAATSGASVATKLLLAAAIGGAAALGYGVLSPTHERASPSEGQLAAKSIPTVTVEPTSQHRSEPEPAVPPSDVVPPSPAPNADAESSRPSNARSVSQREIAQLVRIRAQLERDPARAHRSILASSREFPDGMFAEERAGLDVIALHRSGERQRAVAAAQRFIALYPKSPLRPRLEQILTGDAP